MCFLWLTSVTLVSSFILFWKQFNNLFYTHSFRGNTNIHRCQSYQPWTNNFPDLVPTLVINSNFFAIGMLILLLMTMVQCGTGFSHRKLYKTQFFFYFLNTVQYFTNLFNFYKLTNWGIFLNKKNNIYMFELLLKKNVDVDYPYLEKINILLDTYAPFKRTDKYNLRF